MIDKKLKPKQKKNDIQVTGSEVSENAWKEMKNTLTPKMLEEMEERVWNELETKASNARILSLIGILKQKQRSLSDEEVIEFVSAFSQGSKK